MVEFLKENFLSPFVLVAVVFCIFIYSGFFKSKERFPYKSLIPLEKIETASGIVCSNPSKISSGKSYVVKLKLSSVSGEISGAKINSQASGKISVLVPAKIVESLYPGKLYSSSKNGVIIEEGETITFYGKFSKSFFSAESAEQLQQPQSLKQKIFRFRAFCRFAFKRLMYGWGSAGGFILALLSGSREYTDSSLCETFRNAGLSHVLALSGMHLSFFSSIAGGTGKKILGKKFDFWLRLFGILFFVWFAGLSPSLFRALLCSLILLFCGIFFCVQVNFFKVLCFVFLLHCMIFPDDIFSAAFILSYGALAGILLFGNAFKHIFQSFFPKKISYSLSASAGAQSVAFPLSLVLFKSAAPGGILASVAICPLVSIFLTFSMVAILFSFMIPFLSPFFGAIMNFLYQIIKLTAELFALLPLVEF